MKKLPLITAMLSLAVIFFLSSCQKDAVSVNDFAESESESQVSEIVESVDDDVQSVSNKGGAGMNALPSCLTVTDSLPNGSGFPKIKILDYGPVNCTTHHNMQKRGRIFITFTDTFINPGAMRTVSFDNFFVNDNQLTGTRSSTNSGLNANSNWVVTTANNVTVTRPDGSFVTRTSTGSKEWTSGFLTPLRSDDVFLLSGSGSLSTSGGTTASRNILTALLIDRSCKFPLSGVVELTPPNGNIITIDYGTGTCDNQATVTKNGQTFTINLHLHRVRRP